LHRQAPLMPWARLDDGLIDHPKFNELMMEPDGWAAFGFWAAMLIWANKHTRKPGKVPGLLKRADVAAMDRANSGRFAGLLVKVALWDLHDDGWLIHDFAVYLPRQETSEVRSEAGRKGGQASGRARKEAQSLRDEAQSFDAEAGASISRSKTQANTGYGKGSSKQVQVVGGTSLVAENRADVERLCLQLADAVEGNGSRRPNITQAWRDACRLLLDKDKRTEEQVAACIRWCQDDEFWHANILSMPKLREKYDQLRLKAQRDQRGSTTESTGTTRARQALEAGQRLTEREGQA
jgi:hypothetical protein